jgi:hypothetical protein
VLLTECVLPIWAQRPGREEGRAPGAGVRAKTPNLGSSRSASQIL